MYQSQFEKRYISETGQEAKIAAVIEATTEDLGYQLVRVRISSREGCTVQIMAERPNGEMNVEDCAILSRALSALFDVEDPISGHYHLEVSSPGIDRPLVRAKDFADWIGYEAKLETRYMIEGRKRYRGRIMQADETGVTLRLVDAPQEQNEFHCAYEDLNEAKLMTTDDLITTALRRAKAQKAAINASGEVSYHRPSAEKTSQVYQMLESV